MTGYQTVSTALYSSGRGTMSEKKKINWEHVGLATLFLVGFVAAAYFWLIGEATRANTIMLFLLFVTVLRASTGRRRWRK